MRTVAERMEVWKTGTKDRKVTAYYLPDEKRGSLRILPVLRTTATRIKGSR